MRRRGHAGACTPASGCAGSTPGGAVPAHVHSYEESLYVARRAAWSCRHRARRSRLGPGRLRADPGRRAALAAQRRRRPRRGARGCRRPLPRPALRPRHPARARAGRRPSRSPVDVRDPRTRRFGHIDPAQHGPGAADPGPARRVGEHAHRAAGLQRDHREDDGRLRPRRRAVDDVHGAVRAGRRGRRARPPVRGDLPDPRGRGRGDLRRRRRTCSSRATSRGPASGCVHGFRNVGDGPVRWLETQAPQPPGAALATGSPGTGTTCDNGSARRTADADRGDRRDVRDRAGGRPRAARRAATRWCSPGATPTGRRRWRRRVGGSTSRGIALDLTDTHGAGRRAGRRRAGRPAGDRRDRARPEHRSPTTTSTGRPGWRCSSWSATPRWSTRCCRGWTTTSSIVLFGGRAKDRPYPGSTTVSTVNGGVVGLVHTLAARAGADPGQRAPPGHRRRQPVLVGQAGGGARRLRLAHADRAAGDDGRHRRRASTSCWRTAAVNAINLYVDGGWLLT